jgi:hypothetical protein
MTNANCRAIRFTRRMRAVLTLAAVVISLVSYQQEAHAENLIKRPGAHNQYKWELEPQLYFRFANFDAVGPGVRASIPFMHNGPIDTINNNIGINFGVLLPFYSGNPAIEIYFTDIISVLGEVGLVSSIWTGPGGNFDVDPLFQGGGRFQFGKVGVLVRIGYPGMSVGANFQF